MFELQLADLLLAIFGVVLIPVIRYFYKSDIEKVKQLTQIKSRLSHLEQQSLAGDKAHTRLEGKTDDLCNRMTRVETLLTKGESK